MTFPHGFLNEEGVSWTGYVDYSVRKVMRNEGSYRVEDGEVFSPEGDRMEDIYVER